MPWLLTSPGHQQPWYWLYKFVGPSFTWGRIFSTCVISIWRNDIKCKICFMFPLKNLARKGFKLICSQLGYIWRRGICHFLLQTTRGLRVGGEISGFNTLTHWGRDTMAAIFQTTFSNGFFWMQMYEFRLTFHWNLFLWVQLTIFQHWFR